jgi:hypothetical protein
MIPYPKLTAANQCNQQAISRSIRFRHLVIPSIEQFEWRPQQRIRKNSAKRRVY